MKLLALLLAAASAAAGPDLRPIDRAGYRAALASHRGKVVLVNFWATWCPPCLAEMPALAALEKKLRDQGFVLVTISADEPDQRAAAAELLARHGVSSAAYWNALVDDEAFIRLVSPGWSGALPALFLYDRRGRLSRSFIGETPAAMIEEAVARLLPTPGTADGRR